MVITIIKMNTNPIHSFQTDYFYLKHVAETHIWKLYLLGSIIFYLLSIVFLNVYITHLKGSLVLNVDIFLTVMLFLLGSFCFPYGRGSLRINSTEIAFIPLLPLFSIIAPYKRHFYFDKPLKITYSNRFQVIKIQQQNKIASIFTINTLDKKDQREIINLLKELTRNNALITFLT
jgi:hypothetical protein